MFSTSNAAKILAAVRFMAVLVTVVCRSYLKEIHCRPLLRTK